MVSTNKPSKFAEWLLSKVLPFDNWSTSLGDFEEYYSMLVKKQSRTVASIWYWKNIISLSPAKFYHSIWWNTIMLKSYLKTAFRSIIRQKAYSFINISGLALGMACCILIMIWVFNELSFDRFHKNSNTLFRVELDTGSEGNKFHIYVTPYPLSPVLKEEFPEIIADTRFIELSRQIVKYQDTEFYESGLTAVDPSFLQMFSFPLISGDKETALADPYSIVLTASMAEKYFGSENPISKTITLDNKYELTVTGVIEDVPENSTLEFDMVIPYQFLLNTGRGFENSWGSNEIITFIQAAERASPEDINAKITGVIKSHISTSAVPMLFPLTDIKLYQRFGYGSVTGNIQYVYIFSIIALFVLLIACINFMNLSTARSAGRAKEIGIRKVVGALRGNLISQFYGEAIIMSLMALVLSLVLVTAALPAFNTLTGKSFSYLYILNFPVLIGVFVIAIVTGLLSGSYPALFLSSFRPIKVLKGDLKSASSNSALRKGLVVIQFSLSVFLIIGTIVIYNQLVYMNSKNLGWEKEHIIYIPIDGELRNSYSMIKKELLISPAVVNVSATYQLPFMMSANARGAEWDGHVFDRETSPRIGINYVDFDFTQTLNIEIIEGRGFSTEFPSDSIAGHLINETMAKIMDKETVAGERFDFVAEGTVIGVMKDFHFLPVNSAITPLVLFVSRSDINYILVKLSSGDVTEKIQTLQETWKGIMPDYPLDYSFLDDDFEILYKAESKMANLLKVFSVFAIFIASLGLFGLASYSTEQRAKEIGIRKTLGASEGMLVYLLIKEFVILVILSNLIAWPVSWFVMRNWLTAFPYRDELSVVTFVSAGCISLVIALITVGYKSIKAALTNPVISLKCE